MKIKECGTATVRGIPQISSKHVRNHIRSASSQHMSMQLLPSSISLQNRCDARPPKWPSFICFVSRVFGPTFQTLVRSHTLIFFPLPLSCLRMTPMSSFLRVTKFHEMSTLWESISRIDANVSKFRLVHLGVRRCQNKNPRI